MFSDVFFGAYATLKIKLSFLCDGIDFISNPDLITQPEYAVRSAIEFWKFFNLSSKPNLTEVRRVIGGSLFGLDTVTQYYNKMKT